MKRPFLSYIFVLLVGWCGGCIENDIPYPVIVGDVNQIAFAGQKEMKIDPAKRVITLVLNDTVDMRAVEVLALELSPEARSTIKKGDLVDFSNGDKADYVLADSAYKFNVSTYQDYEWRIEVSQPLGLKIDVGGSVGDANIDVFSKNVVVSVAKGTDRYGVVVREFCLGPASATYSPDPFAVTNYSVPRTFTVSFFGLTQEWTVALVESNSNVATGTVNPWAKFAEVSGDALASSPLEAAFAYRKKSDAEWQSEPAKRTGGKISAVLKGLSPNTAYEFRAKLGEELGAIKAFTTEAVPEIANMGFEDWNSPDNQKTWFPNKYAGSTFDMGYWSSGNEGVTSPLAGGNPSNTTPTEDRHEGALAARIETIAANVVGLAAGSIFTGYFKLTPTAALTSTKFSRPYVGRPTQLSFWYKYAPKDIDVAKKNPDELGKPDRCIVYIYLGDWNGTHPEFPGALYSDEIKREKTEGVIAYGEFITDKNVSSYTQQTINLTYYDRTKPVKRILVVGTSSIYGDSYTGGVGSTLFLDDLQFGWDYVE